MGRISGGTANDIVLDIGQDVPPDKSTRVTYGPDELAFRKRVEDWWAKKREEDPKAVLDVRE